MFIQLNGQVLSYEKSGCGRPLILLHGNGEDCHIFDELTENINNNFEVYAIDSRGHGGSSTSSEYHYADMASDVINFIQALELSKPIILGFSDGAIIALMVAMKCSDMLGGIICCGANLSPKGLSFSARSEIKKMYKESGSPLVKMMMDEPNISPEDLHSINVKAIIIAGDKDMVKEKETRLIASNISDSELIILGGQDHSSYVVHSTMLTDIILQNFL